MAPDLVPSPRHLRRTSSPARIPDWEREEGRLRSWRPTSCRRPVIFGGRRLLLASLTGSERRGDSAMAPDLVPSPRHLGGRRLLLASLTGSERGGDSVHGARPRAVAPTTDMLLSQTAPGGGDSSISLASSSTTHSVTGPAPRASMTENSANANLGVSSY